jgi:hypothetical protein
MKRQKLTNKKRKIINKNKIIENNKKNNENICLLKKLIIDEINKLNNKNNNRIYKVKYTNEYYLNMMFEVKNNINNWKYLTQLKAYNSDKQNHYKTIYNKFIEWTNQNIFINVFNNYICLTKTNILLIDATNINNKYGSDNITLNSKYKKKKITKLLIVTNTFGFIYSIIPFNIKNTNNIYSTSVHDVKMINENLNNIKNINKSNNIYYKLLGDKGYKTNEQFIFNNKKIKTLTPNKINSIKKNTKFNKKQLKKRNLVERFIGIIKQNNRIMVKKERKLKYFISFIYISCLLNNIKCNI